MKMLVIEIFNLAFLLVSFSFFCFYIKFFDNFLDKIFDEFCDKNFLMNFLTNFLTNESIIIILFNFSDAGRQAGR